MPRVPHFEPEEGRDFILCDQGSCYIYREDEYYEGDKYYDFDGFIVCEECLSEYCKEHKRVLV